MEARYDGERPPTISFALGDVFKSLEYDFGGRGEYRRRQWRVPPFVDPSATLRVEVAVPEGTTLSIRGFGCQSQAAAPCWNGGGVRLNAHRQGDAALLGVLHSVSQDVGGNLLQAELVAPKGRGNVSVRFSFDCTSM